MHRTSLKLLIISMLVTLSALFGVTRTTNTAAAISTPLIGSINISVFAPTRAVYEAAANPLAANNGRSEAARSDVMAAALGFMNVAPPPRPDERSEDTPKAGVARVIAEAIGAGGGFASFGVHGDLGSTGASGALAILLALGMLPDFRFPRRLSTDYLCRIISIFLRPLVRPG